MCWAVVQERKLKEEKMEEGGSSLSGKEERDGERKKPY